MELELIMAWVSRWIFIRETIITMNLPVKEKFKSVIVSMISNAAGGNILVNFRVHLFSMASSHT